MEDFFSLILEEVLGKITERFETINHPVLKATLQILAMIVSCSIFIGIIFLASFFVKNLTAHWDIANNKLLKIILTIGTLLICLAILGGLVFLVTWLIKKQNDNCKCAMLTSGR